MGKKLWVVVGMGSLFGFLMIGLSDVALADDGGTRSILKVSGLLAAILGIIGISIAGYLSVKDYDSYTGWQRFTHGAVMFFNRKPFHKDSPTYGVTESTVRVKWVESILNRLQTLMGLMMPPVAVDAGLGEQGRMGLLLTPELGCNARIACVTTNIPMKVDKPIDFGVQEFCRKCKICAERCPTGAISHSDERSIQYGYRRWKIKDELCFKTWASVTASKVSHGCRICLAVCPYSRKNNWLHSLSRQIDPRDPTGLVSSMLLWMQKVFFKYPEAKDFLPPPEGKNATYHQPPDWLLTEKWFDINKTW